MLGKATGSAGAMPFSETLFKLLNGAKVEAHRLGDTHVRPEHMLLALLRPGMAPRAGHALEAVQVASERIRQTLEPVAAADVPATQDELPWDRRAKTILGRTIEHSRARGRFSSEDLLLAIAEGKQGLAAGLLRWHGASPERLRQVLKALPESPGE